MWRHGKISRAPKATAGTGACPVCEHRLGQRSRLQRCAHCGIYVELPVAEKVLITRVVRMN
jgi:hypothetical protein